MSISHRRPTDPTRHSPCIRETLHTLSVLQSEAVTVCSGDTFPLNSASTATHRGQRNNWKSRCIPSRAHAGCRFSQPQVVKAKIIGRRVVAWANQSPVPWLVASCVLQSFPGSRLGCPQVLKLIERPVAFGLINFRCRGSSRRLSLNSLRVPGLAPPSSPALLASKSIVAFSSFRRHCALTIRKILTSWHPSAGPQDVLIAL